MRGGTYRCIHGAVHVFGGKFDPAKAGFPWELNPAMNKMPASDIRDRQAISAWGRELAVKLEFGQPQGRHGPWGK
jgi:hypothetical protein